MNGEAAPHETPRPWLALDASAGGATVALFAGERLVDERTLARHGSAEALAPAVATLLGGAGVPAASLWRIVVGNGPGSFTGVRVAAAFANGLAHGAGVAVHVVPSLALIVAGPVPSLAPGGYVAVLDALRGEWFVQRCDVGDAGVVRAVGARELLPRGAVERMAHDEGRLVVGPPVDATRLPHARGAVRLVARAVTVGGWEPDYGRLAEAQVQWEAAHGRPLPVG